MAGADGHARVVLLSQRLIGGEVEEESRNIPCCCDAQTAEDASDSLTSPDLPDAIHGTPSKRNNGSSISLLQLIFINIYIYIYDGLLVELGAGRADLFLDLNARFDQFHGAADDALDGTGH